MKKNTYMFFVCRFSEFSCPSDKLNTDAFNGTKILNWNLKSNRVEQKRCLWFLFCRIPCFSMWHCFVRSFISKCQCQCQIDNFIAKILRLLFCTAFGNFLLFVENCIPFVGSSTQQSESKRIKCCLIRVQAWIHADRLFDYKFWLALVSV